MRVPDVIRKVKRTFGDEAGVQITDEDILSWINDAQEEIVIQNEGLMETTGSYDLQAEQMTFPAPPDMSVLRSLKYKGYRLKFMSVAEFNEYIDGYSAAPGISPYGPGIPEIFTVWDNTITVFPKPMPPIVQNNITIFYMRHPAIVGPGSVDLSVPVQYHKAIVDYCLKSAYELDEDLEKSGFKKNEFDEKMMKLNDRNKWISQEYYPRITTLPEDENYGNYGYWGGYF